MNESTFLPLAFRYGGVTYVLQEVARRYAEVTYCHALRFIQAPAGVNLINNNDDILDHVATILPKTTFGFNAGVQGEPVILCVASSKQAPYINAFLGLVEQIRGREKDRELVAIPPSPIDQVRVLILDASPSPQELIASLPHSLPSSVEEASAVEEPQDASGQRDIPLGSLSPALLTSATPVGDTPYTDDLHAGTPTEKEEPPLATLLTSRPEWDTPVPRPEPLPNPDEEDTKPKLGPKLTVAPQPSPPVPSSRSSLPTLEVSALPQHPVLHMGGVYYALLSPNTTGSTAVVWQARKLDRLPEQGVQVLTPSAETRTRLIRDAAARTAYADSDPSGELVALKTALPGKETALEKEAKALQRLGASVLRLHFPAFEQTWPEGFPCLVMEWVQGEKLSEHGAPYPEQEGLQICLQLVNILYAARLSAPDIVLTDSLKGDGVFIQRDERGNFQTRILDWNVYETQEGNVRERTLIRFGEVMAGIFAPALGFKINRATNEVPFEDLGKGKPGDTGAKQWDQLSYGARTLIRRVLQRDFEGGADVIISAMQTAIKEELARWTEPDPLARARRESGPARLNWLDMIRAKGKPLSPEDQEQYTRLLRERADDFGRQGLHIAALTDLRSAMRIHPDDSYFRWATLAHAIAEASADGSRAFQRLRLDESLAHLRYDRYVEAQASLEWALAFIGQVQFKRARETAENYLEALTHRARILASVSGALLRLKEDWRIEDAETAYEHAGEWERACDRFEASLLFGQDALCRARIEELNQQIAAFQKAQGDYAGALRKPELLAEVRRKNFARLLERAAVLFNLGNTPPRPDLWIASIQIYNRAMAEYTDLWREQEQPAEKLRQDAANQLASHYRQQAEDYLHEDNWFPDRAQMFLQQAILYKQADPETLSLQTALENYRRAEVSLHLGELEAARAALRGAQLHEKLQTQTALLLALLEHLSRLRDLSNKLTSNITHADLEPTLKDTRLALQQASVWLNAHPHSGAEMLREAIIALEAAENPARQTLLRQIWGAAYDEITARRSALPAGLMTAWETARLIATEGAHPASSASGGGVPTRVSTPTPPRVALLKLTEPPSLENRQAFSVAMAASSQDDLRNIIDLLGKLSHEAQERVRGLASMPSAPPSHRGDTAPEILRSALDTIWQNLWSIIKTQESPELSAFAYSETLRNAENQMGLVQAVVNLLNDRQLKILADASELIPAESKDRGTEQPLRFAYELREIYPDTKALQKLARVRLGQPLPLPPRFAGWKWKLVVIILISGLVACGLGFAALFMFPGQVVAMLATDMPIPTETITPMPPSETPVPSVPTTTPPTHTPVPATDTPTPTSSPSPTVTVTPVSQIQVAFECSKLEQDKITCILKNGGNESVTIKLAFIPFDKASLNTYSIYVDKDNTADRTAGILVESASNGITDLGSFAMGEYTITLHVFKFPSGPDQPTTTVHVSLLVNGLKVEGSQIPLIFDDSTPTPTPTFTTTPTETATQTPTATPSPTP